MKLNNLFLAKTFCVILLLFVINYSFSQHNKSKIDSLNQIINSSTIDSIKIKSYKTLAFDYYLNNQLIEAELYSNKILQLATKNDYQLSIADSYNLFGIISKKKGFYELALENYNKALATYKKINEKMGESIVLNNISIIYNLQSNLDKAIEYQIKTLKIKEQLGDKKSITVSLNNIGNFYTDYGYYDKALEYYNQSLKICKELNDKPGIANSLNNIGIIYFYQNNFEKAAEYYNLSLFIFKELNYTLDVSSAYNNLASIYLKIGDYDKSLDFYNKALIIEKNNGNIIEIGDLLNNMAMVYNGKGNNKKALEYFFMAHDSYLKSHDIYKVSTTLCSIGIVYFQMNDKNNSIKYILASNKIASENGFIEILKANYVELADIYRETNDFKNAYINMSLYSMYKDSVLNQEKQKQIIELQSRYETEKKEKEIVLLNKDKKLNETEIKNHIEEIQKQRIIIYSFVIIVIIIIIFSYFIYKLFIQKQKAYKLLAKKNIEVELKNKEITDSINYAKRIQQAILPSLSSKPQVSSLKPQNLKLGTWNLEFETFILFRPKDIVSGDFYWFSKVNNSLIYAVADCTGHGVPGAFMSMLGISFLNEIVRKKEVVIANEVLNELRKEIINALQQKGMTGEQKDGMDMSLVAIKVQDSNPKFKDSSLKSQIPNSKLQDEESNQYSVSSKQSSVGSKQTTIKDSQFATSTSNLNRACELNEVKLQTSNFYNAQWAGANNPLWIVRAVSQSSGLLFEPEVRDTDFPNLENLEEHMNQRFVLQEVKPDKMPIAIYEKMDSFTNHEIQLHSGDILYLMSDGYEDQFGGTQFKKFLSKNLKQLLLDNSQLPMYEQKQILEEILVDWIGEGEQIDDITILGIRI